MVVHNSAEKNIEIMHGRHERIGQLMQHEGLKLLKVPEGADNDLDFGWWRNKEIPLADVIEILSRGVDIERRAKDSLQSILLTKHLTEKK